MGLIFCERRWITSNKHWTFFHIGVRNETYQNVCRLWCKTTEQKPEKRITRRHGSSVDGEKRGNRILFLPLSLQRAIETTKVLRLKSVFRFYVHALALSDTITSTLPQHYMPMETWKIERVFALSTAFEPIHLHAYSQVHTCSQSLTQTHTRDSVRVRIYLLCIRMYRINVHTKVA